MPVSKARYKLGSFQITSTVREISGAQYGRPTLNNYYYYYYYLGMSVLLVVLLEYFKFLEMRQVPVVRFTLSSTTIVGITRASSLTIQFQECVSTIPTS